MTINVFIDGVIYGLQQHGGISRMWTEIIPRLSDYDVSARVLVSPCSHNESLQKLLASDSRAEIIVEKIPHFLAHRLKIRSLAFKSLYHSQCDQVFQSTFYTTIPLSKIPKVIYIHDLIPETFTDNPDPDVASQKRIKKWVIKQSNYFICVSNNTKSDLMRVYKIPEDRVEVIYHGASKLTTNNLSVYNANGSLGIDISSTKFFLFVGKRNGYKNFQIIADLFKSYPEFRGFKVVCIGGEDSTSDKTLLRDFGIEEFFVFLGHINDSQLRVLYQNATALLYPSQYEGFGLPVLEAMVNQCPVVCANTSSLPEVGGNAAFYFDPSSVNSLVDVIRRLLSSNRIEVVEAGLRNVNRFSWDRSAEQLAAVYHRLAGSKQN